MLTCPRCDGQGAIQKLVVRQSGVALFACDECDATWFTRDAIGIVPWVDLSTYMESIGLQANQNDLETVGYVES